MVPRDSFAELAGKLRDGDPDAAAEVHRRFVGRLVALARAELDTRLRRKVDPEDVVQSVYRSFFTRGAAGQFALAAWGEVWALLAVITVRKCAGRAEYFRAGRRDVAAEVDAPAPAGDPDSWAVAVDREPTPPEAAMLAETIERVMSGLDAEDREVVALSLQGYTVAEIGARLGRAERTVRRLRERVRKRLERMRAETSGEP